MDASTVQDLTAPALPANPPEAATLSPRPLPTGTAAFDASAVPPTVDPVIILDQTASALAADPFISAIIEKGMLTQQVVHLHAQAMKFVARSRPERAATYQQWFTDGYSKTVFGASGLAATTFAAAAPSDVPYVAFFSCFSTLARGDMADLYGAMGKSTTPVGRATADAFGLLAPGGLEEPTFALACAIIRSDLVSVGGELRYSEMDENATIDGREIEDNDISKIQERIDLAYAPVIGGAKVALLRNMMDRAVNKVAMERPFHEVRSYLLGLPKWDGQRRLKYVVRDLLRAEPRREELETMLHNLDRNARRATIKRISLARKMIRKFFIAGVARTLDPGCKHDSVLILKGKQGRMKSTFFRTITPCGRFSDNDMELKEKDSKLELRKAFIFEWSELSTLRSARDWETVKGFLARQEDTVRPPYAKRASIRKRHCVIVGTTNEAEFLGDSTGSRRFWVIEAGEQKADLQKAAEQRDQLWAEALHLYRSGLRWWFEGADDVVRERENARHTVEDPWKDTVEHFIESWADRFKAKPPSSNEVLAQALMLDPAKTTKEDVRHVGRVLRALGYEAQPCWDPSTKKSYKGWVKDGA